MNEFELHEEQLSGLSRVLEREQERLAEKAERLKGLLEIMNYIGDLLEEKKSLQDEVDLLHEQIADERREKAELEMRVAEMGKLTAGVAKKSSEEAVLKALSTYVSHSKQKTADKRAFAKTAALEIANAIKLTLPDELAASIDSLDDEQSEPKVVNVAGNFNDIHENGEVKVKV